MKPILIFPKPQIVPRKKERRPIPQPTTPGRARQGLRLNSKFNFLQKNFEKGILSSDPAGFAPERTLVLETIGSIEKFYRAAAKIDGFEFIQELLGDEVEPDDDFHLLDKGKVQDKSLAGYAYLTIANQTALNRLLHYWDKYTKREKYKFPRGLGPLKNLFEHLKNIRYWDTEDRLRETGLLEDWGYRVSSGEDVLPVEVELWYRNSSSSRIAAERRIGQFISRLGGAIQQTCVINEISYHAILANIPAKSVEDVIHTGTDDVELLRCDEVMYFRPTGQCMAPIFTKEEDGQTEYSAEVVNGDTSEVSDEANVALLDGLPLENHIWIRDFIYIDDPDGWSEDYTADDQNHGTSMASLIIRGDMEARENRESIPRKLYCRPIMKPFIAGFDGKTREKIPDDILPIDIIHRSVLRIFEGEAGQPPVAPTVKIVNLSVADPNRLFDKVVSPWAKLIDYLSEKYKVLFVVSAGNHLHDIDLGITNAEFNTLSSADKEDLILKSVSENIHTRRLMSPAESINAITVAASHFDEVEDDEFYNQINPYSNRALPSTINPITWGKKRSVKPEVLMPGGRATYRLKNIMDNQPAVLSLLTYNRPPGQKVASPGAAGSLNSFAYTIGTSNSAALTSRRLCFLSETLQDLYNNAPHGESLSREYESVLLKALLCHGAEHSEIITQIERVLKNEKNSQRFKAIAAKYLGYGNVDQERIHGCTDNQATILQCGLIKQDDIHTYKFKLPDSLNAKAVIKRLIITLAWLSPIDAKKNKYRKAFLLFEPATGDKEDNYLKLQSRELDWQMVKNGTVQHEVLSGERAAAYADGTNLEISVECRGHADAKNIEVPYGLVVTLDTPDIDLKIYDEVKAGIESLFEIQAAIDQPVRT